MPTSNLHGALTGTSATRVNPIEVAAPERVRAAQADLKVLVERGASADPSADSRTETELESRIRNRLSVKAEVEMLRYEAFERPGARKISLTIRERPVL